jgi:hypothetical protein
MRTDSSGLEDSSLYCRCMQGSPDVLLELSMSLRIRPRFKRLHTRHAAVQQHARAPRGQTIDPFMCVPSGAAAHMLSAWLGAESPLQKCRYKLGASYTTHCGVSVTRRRVAVQVTNHSGQRKMDTATGCLQQHPLLVPLLVILFVFGGTAPSG